MAFSLAWPVPGKWVNSLQVNGWKIVQTINVVTIFIISGLMLQTKEIKDAVRQWPAALLGIISILFITPTAAFALARIPFTPPQYTYGLVIFALVPTTIASGGWCMVLDGQSVVWVGVDVGVGW